MLLKIKRKFSCAHRLPNYEGKCEALHGHTWESEDACAIAKEK